MKIFDKIKMKYNCVISDIEHRAEEKRLEHEAQLEREKHRVQGILNSDIPWDRVIELDCEYADENEDVCYIKKCVMCDIERKEIWDNSDIEGVIISGDDFGKSVTLSVGEDFYGRKQISFWDNFDYVWYSYGDVPTLSSKLFKTVSELNEYINAYNKSRIDGVCQDDIVSTPK